MQHRNLQTVHTIEATRAAIAAARESGASIALVPTMGNLHEGHLHLVQTAQSKHDFVAVSVFVNPLQFGAGEDFGSYPRTLEADSKALTDIGAQLLFAPPVEEIYPHGQDDQAQISLPSLADTLCGKHRAGHFDGVATVVMKLLNITTPDAAFFGEKDFQQLLVLKTLVRDFNMNVRVEGVPTVRAADGLALSSRNQYLSTAQRKQAPLIHQTLHDIAFALKEGASQRDRLLQTGRLALKNAGFEIDYLELVDATNLQPPAAGSKQLRLLVAATLGDARLIDNIGISL